MRNQLLAVSGLTFAVVFTGLVTLSGTLMLVATPLVLYLLGSWLLVPPPAELRVARRLERERANPEEPVEVEVTVENVGAPLAEVVARDLVPSGLRVINGTPAGRARLAGGETLTFSYTVVGTRGSYEFERIVVETAGDLAMRAAVRRYDIEQELITLPDHRELARIPIAPRRTLVYAGTNPARRGGEGTEFFDVREHRGGESMRRVNWRASARSPDRLFVNEYQQERVADVAVLLDCRSRVYPAAAGGELFDAAATAAASLVDVIVDAGNRVGYLGYGLSLDWLSPGFGRVQKHRILNRIARAVPGESHVFFRLDALPERLFPPGSQVILVSPLSEDDPPALERLQASGYAVMVVTPDPLPPTPAPDAADALREAARIARLQRAVLLRRLRHRGIAVIDWDTGSSLGSAVAQAYGGIVATWRHRHR